MTDTEKHKSADTEERTVEEAFEELDQLAEKLEDPGTSLEDSSVFINRAWSC